MDDGVEARISPEGVESGLTRDPNHESGPILVPTLEILKRTVHVTELSIGPRDAYRPDVLRRLSRLNLPQELACLCRLASCCEAPGEQCQIRRDRRALH